MYIFQVKVGSLDVQKKNESPNMSLVVISEPSFHSKNWAKLAAKLLLPFQKKYVTLKIVTNITLLINSSDLTLHKVKVMAKVAYQDSQKIKIIKQEITLVVWLVGCTAVQALQLHCADQFHGIASNTYTTKVGY